MDATQWDRRYRDAAHGPWAARPPLLVAELVGSLVPGRALDLGSGDGRSAAWLAERGWHVTAVDFSAAALESAAARMGRLPGEVRLEHADVGTWRAPHRYELVLIAYLHLPSELMRVVGARAAGWVEPGGHLLVLGHDLANLGTDAPGPRDPDVLYTPALLAGLAQGLTIERVGSVVRRGSDDPETADGDTSSAIDAVLFASAPMP